ncbi:epidermal growth factor receptor kinase substrate 8-like protein 1 isoform X2 [Piliocolobus tephrosceles]|uniref:epidermal growth factor receptor kinase substrate 8-like protein 1 isoform X2 n=1 Tax=Piliocolobus tephrosceles TaxID=591936 RepID=UPI000C2B36B5|nr:epidermal growth factor receptor kinase substrate 8-like protein 1 isoform X2 [Piliocolobus tephrosceles]
MNRTWASRAWGSSQDEDGGEKPPPWAGSWFGAGTGVGRGVSPERGRAWVHRRERWPHVGWDGAEKSARGVARVGRGCGVGRRGLMCDWQAELIREDIQGALHNYRSGRGERRAAALRATQEELQRDRSPAAETPPLQRRPSVRAVISNVERSAGRGRPQAKPIPEAEEAQRPGPAGTSSSADPASPDLGPRGPDLAVLQAEREVDILNHVFDDVESFVSRLQKSAEAARVLEHRERGRRTRRRAAGEGLLTLRAKPPSEAEYTDVLQKIKYAFSLLARLRGNIADPSSPELLHFLFGPLQMIVNTSGGPEFASSVRRPHLTSDAVALLRDNVTPRENELWTSLGDSWTRPGLELPPEEGPPYRPEFFSGWEPPVTDPQGRAWEDPVEKQLQHERRRRQVLDDRRKWWKVRDPAGQEGYVPYNILTPHPGPRLHHCQSPARSLNSTPPPPPAPAPAPPPALARPRWDSCDSLNSLDPSEKEKFSQMLIVNEELQARLAQGRSGPSRTVPGPRAPEPQLSPHSDASEVRAWLQAKGFSSGTVDALGVLTGAQLFSLQKEELRAVSPEEGARVYSQVTVQRALLEDKEKVSELEAVMEKQKKKVEGGMEMEVI